LEYDTTTTIAVICNYDHLNYEVVIRKVTSKFYGGCIVQDNFEFKYDSTDENSGYIVTLPTSFSPPAKLKGHVDIFSGDFGSIFPVYSAYRYGIMQDTAYYSYCVNEYTTKEQIFKWVRIGPTGYIWAEIENRDLSYLFDFEVIEAKMILTALDVEICGENSLEVELEIIFPKPDNPDDIKRDHILPNCVLLKAPEPKGFFNKDWELIIKYKYKLLEPFKGKKVVWPSDLDGKNSMNKFVNPPFLLDTYGHFFEVENIRSGTVAVMAYIEDTDGRVQSAIATKMLMDVVTTRCRPVEISYSYTADAIGYDLIPNSGFFTWTGGDKVLSGDYKHHNQPKCGDHDCNPKNCIGPMWFPFNDCTTIDFYSWYSGAATCYNLIEGQGSLFAPQPRFDWRYCMAHDYKAWVRENNNWAAACGNGWYYSYSKAGESVFSGYGKIRTSVLSDFYAEMGWTMPPFGNDGREITERWLSQEHHGFWDLSGIRPISKSEYMPLVFDDEMLFTSFNAFDEKGRIGLIDDYFHTTCMLNCMLSKVISEELTKDRHRFEDLFRVINHAWCMYPPPLYEGLYNSPFTVKRYSFKIDNVAWAWREYWKDIERNVSEEMIFNFVEFNKPVYYFDFEKTEHRLITDEGEVFIVFKAPMIKEDGDYEYPEISIENGFPRKFEILYDDYDSEQVEW
ncbi:MAG: hypothetical protein U9O65_07020, partial [Thermotogota bacterium]|nr:hypothetical protein [Thermotogota bacterium]